MGVKLKEDQKILGYIRRILFLVCVGVPTVFACYWWARCNELENSSLQADVSVAAEQQTSAEVWQTSPEQDILRLLEQDGISLEEVLRGYDGVDATALTAAYQALHQNAPELPSYTKDYPTLYTTPPSESISLPNTVYLTFDDGPSENTQAVLDILAKNQIKATFFVCPKADGSDQELLRKIAEGGHTIGIHSATHVYKKIYADVESYLADFSAAFDRVVAATGKKPEIFRFPGGSINAYNGGIYQRLIAEMTRRGFTYYDWNVEGGETSHSIKAAKIQDTVLRSASRWERPVILLHDGPGHQETVKALEPIIAGLKAKGFAFEPLQNTVRPVVFSYNKVE